MKKLDPLKQFVALHQLLNKEKLQLEARLAEIYQTLGEAGIATPNGPRLHPSSAPPAKVARRIKNPISLPKAVLQLTSKRPMTKQEILSEVKRLGYRFTAKDPVNSLNTVLYGKKPKFMHEGGKFSSVGVQAKASQSAAGGGPGKHQMSRATRSKLSAIAKARWAKIKQSQGG